MPITQGITTIKGMTVSGIHHLVERAYREGHEHQYLREVLVNALEAGASRIEFGPDWHGVEHERVYRLMIADDGRGMSPDELLMFFNTFGGGGKPIGTEHENFGVGAKTSLLPWNHEGVIVVSWTEDNPEGAMVWLARDPDTQEYGLRILQDVDGAWDAVIRPARRWAKIRPDWIKSHGTVVVCLGNAGTEDTFVSKDGTGGDTKGIAAYLNRRIWEIPQGVEVFVQELRSHKRTEWPRSLKEATTPGRGADGVDRRWNRRRVRGAKYFVNEIALDRGRLGDCGTVKLADQTEIDWYLWDGERPAVHDYAQEVGFIAALYRNEMYDLTSHGAKFRSFGITQAEVRRCLTLVARPPIFAEGQWGVYPDTSRNSLKVQGTRRAGEPLPWDEWADEFARNLPDAISVALAKAGPSRTGTLMTGERLQQLWDRFSKQWKTLRYVAHAQGTFRIIPDQPPGALGGSAGRGEAGDGGSVGNAPGPTGEALDEVSTMSRELKPAAATGARPLMTKGGLPSYEWTTLENTDEDGIYPVAWYRETKDHPNGVVQIARDFKMFVELKKFWRGQYPDHLGEDVDAIIEQVYGEALVARIAHSEQLIHDPTWGRTRVEEELRSQAALTASLLGLLSEDYAISSRLNGLGVKRRVA